MTVHLITYDLNSEAKRPPIVRSIKDLGGWAKLSESSYAVNSNLTTSQIYEAISNHIDDNDQVYIIPLKKPWMGFGPKDVNDWLNENISY